MKKWNVAAVRAAKGVEKLGCCTAYDACFARLADEAGVPIILVGDSMGMNVLGYATTLPVEMSDMLAAVGAVARSVKDALVVGDMPFGSYQCGEDAAVANAATRAKSRSAKTSKKRSARRAGPVVVGRFNRSTSFATSFAASKGFDSSERRRISSATSATAISCGAASSEFGAFDAS